MRCEVWKISAKWKTFSKIGLFLQPVAHDTCSGIFFFQFPEVTSFALCTYIVQTSVASQSSSVLAEVECQ